MNGPTEGQDDYVCEKMLRKFELVQKLGHSPFGIVWRATDKSTRVSVALKKVYGAMKDKNRAQMAYRELTSIEMLQGHDNIVNFRNVMFGTNDIDLYFVFEYVESDLYNAIRHKVVQEKHFAYISYQVLRALSFVHSKGLVHRDVKPSNILIDGKCQVKLCDFGHCRSLIGIDDPISHNNVAGSNTTDYLGSRWYRAPESLLGTNRTTTAVDIWGFGCVLGEMILGQPVFQGKSTSNQLQLIIDLTGYPTKEQIAKIQAPTKEEQLDPKILGKLNPRALSQVFGKAKAEAIDVLRLCLQFEPSARTTALSLLQHPFMIEYYHEYLQVGEKDIESAVSLPLNDNILYTVSEYKHIIKKNIDKKLDAIKVKLGEQERFGYYQDKTL